MRLVCEHCRSEITGTMRGAGDGAGEKFMHNECWLTIQLRRLEKENADLRKRLQQVRNATRYEP